MATDSFDFNEDEDDGPARRRRDDDDFDRPASRSRYRDSAEEDYGDDLLPRRNKSDGLGVAAMITGLVSLLLTLGGSVGACLCVLGLFAVGLGVIGGIVAVILGFSARSRTPGSGMGLAGILTGFGSILLSLVILVLAIIGFGFLAMKPPPPPNNGPVARPVNNQPNFNNQPKRFK